MNESIEDRYRFELEITLASLETRSNISTFLAGVIFIIIPIVIQLPEKFPVSQFYMLLLFVGAMFLTFSSVSYFETAATTRSVVFAEKDESPVGELARRMNAHLEKTRRLCRFGDVLFAIGIVFFMAANVWMISGFGFIFSIIAAIVSILFLWVLVMKR